MGQMTNKVCLNVHVMLPQNCLIFNDFDTLIY